MFLHLWLDWGAEQAPVYNSQADDLFGQHVGKRLHTQEEQMVCDAVAFYREAQHYFVFLVVSGSSVQVTNTCSPTRLCFSHQWSSFSSRHFETVEHSCHGTSRQRRHCFLENAWRLISSTSPSTFSCSAQWLRHFGQCNRFSVLIYLFTSVLRFQFCFWQSLAW